MASAIQSFDEASIGADLEKLFELLKSDKPQGGQNDEIEKSTLMSLMLYLDLQKDEPEFFQYVKERLIDSSQTINMKQFQDTLLKPQISFDQLTSDKMASYFKIFDKEKKGSFSCDEFLELYKTSPEYLQSDEQKKKSVVEEIKEHFRIMEKDNRKEITPIEFFNIINFNSSN